MKTIQLSKTIILACLTLSTSAMAEGKNCKGGDCGFSNAAEKYEHKAKHAKKEGKHEAARIYKRMAQIKRDAAAGKLKNWDEYHKLEGKLSKAMGWDKKGKCDDKGKCNDKKDKAGCDDKNGRCDDKKKRGKGISKYQDKHKKKYAEKHAKKAHKKANEKTDKQLPASKKKSTPSRFEKQANQHRQIASKALKSGNLELADLHQKLAQRLVEASMQKKRGEKPDLTEYFELQKKLLLADQDDSSEDESDVENW